MWFLVTSLTIYAVGSGPISMTLMRPVSPLSAMDTGTATLERSSPPAAAKLSPGLLIRVEESCRIRHQTKPDPRLHEQGDHLIKGKHWPLLLYWCFCYRKIREGLGHTAQHLSCWADWDLSQREDEERFIWIWRLLLRQHWEWEWEKFQTKTCCILYCII